MYSLKELLDGAEYTCKREIDGIYVTGIKSNSRDVLPGNVFVCLKGCKKNGEDYTAEAIRRGAKVIICDKTCGKCDKNAVECVATHDLFTDLFGFVVEQNDVVTVPTDAAGDVQRHLFVVGEYRRDLITDHFGGVIVTVVH